MISLLAAGCSTASGFSIAPITSDATVASGSHVSSEARTASSREAADALRGKTSKLNRDTAEHYNLLLSASEYDRVDSAPFSAANDSVSLQIGGLLQFRYIANFRGGETGRPGSSPDEDSNTGFEFRRVEVALSGAAANTPLEYKLVLATSYGPGVSDQIIAQDVVLSYQLNENWSITGGRYFAPLLREELIGGGGSLAIALSYMNNVFSIGRSEGISLIYENEDARAQLFFSDGSNNRSNLATDSAEFALSSRVDIRLAGTWEEWGDFTAGDEPAIFLGGAVHFESENSGDTAPYDDFKLFAWTVDGSYQNENIHVYAAIAGRHTERPAAPSINNMGFVVQAGYRPEGRPLEPFARYEMLFFDEDNGYSDNEVKLLTLGLNYHVNPMMKIAGDVVWAMDSMPTDSANAGLLADGMKDNQVALRIQAQLKF